MASKFYFIDYSESKVRRVKFPFEDILGRDIDKIDALKNHLEDTEGHDDFELIEITNTGRLVTHIGTID